MEDVLFLFLTTKQHTSRLIQFSSCNLDTGADTETHSTSVFRGLLSPPKWKECTGFFSDSLIQMAVARVRGSERRCYLSSVSPLKQEEVAGIRAVQEGM